MTPHVRRCLWAFAALAFVCAQAARGDGGDAGAPVDAGVSATASADAAAADAGAAAAAELAKPPDLAPPAPAVTATPAVSPALIDNPTPADAEPPRPITRRLWFWLAVTGVVVGALLVGIAVEHPNRTRPDCPAGYACPP